MHLALISDVQSELKTIKDQISQVTNKIPLESLQSLSNEISVARGYVDQYSPEAEDVETYRLVPRIILCLMFHLSFNV